MAQGATRAAAIRVVIERLQRAGYTGVAHVERGGVARPPWDGVVPQFDT